jgi:hypothetical protein
MLRTTPRRKRLPPLLTQRLTPRRTNALRAFA